MTQQARALSRMKIEGTLSVWDGTTSGDGAVGATSLIDAGLIGENDFITNQTTVLILSGVATGEKRTADTFNVATGEITFTAMSAQIVTGVTYRLINIPTPAIAAAILAGLAVPALDAVTNALERDVIGNKTDTPIVEPDLVSSLMRYAKGNLNAKGLIYKGKITTYTNATQFDALSLAGFGNQAFANGHYFIFAFRDAGGAAALPQGEFRLMQTYVSATGTFTHEAFSAALAADDDIIIIHQSLLFPSAVPGYGDLNTSSATVPADSNRAARYAWEVADHFKGLLLMPLTGTCRFIPRRIDGFTVAGGIFTIDPGNPFPAATGTVEYLILSGQADYVPTVDGARNISTSEVIGNKADTALTAYTAADSIMRYIKGLLDLASATLAGKTQAFTQNNTSAANVGDVLVATATTQRCMVKKVILRSNGVTTVDLTSAALYCNVGKVTTLIDAILGAKANIDVNGEQVSVTGAWDLAVGDTIVITLAGTGATAVDLQITIEYEAVVSGGYLA